MQITWDNPKELEVYISKLQSAAEKLSTENRKLRKWHTDFIEKVATRLSLSLALSLALPLSVSLSLSLLFLNFICGVAGGDADECGPPETSAKVEGRLAGAPHRLRHFGVSGLDSAHRTFLEESLTRPSVAAGGHEHSFQPGNQLH